MRLSTFRVKNFFSLLKQHPNSLYGKVQLRAPAVFGPLGLSAGLGLLVPDHPAVGMLSGVVIGLVLAAFAPWWAWYPERAAPKPGHLFPRVALLARIERRLLVACLFSLLAGFFLDFNADLAMAAQITGSALAAALASAHFPLWKVWPR